MNKDKLFQFTHPCGCDKIMLNYIHQREGFNSRTRVGATRAYNHAPVQERVSIHAPVWVRLFRVVFTTWVTEFQFTHPCGCDSTATKGGEQTNSFNSRTRVGATATHKGR